MPNAKDLKVQVVDMDDDMKAAACDQIMMAFDNFSKEDVIANEIRKNFDKQFE